MLAAFDWQVLEEAGITEPGCCNDWLSKTCVQWALGASWSCSPCTLLERESDETKTNVIVTLTIIDLQLPEILTYFNFVFVFKLSNNNGNAKFEGTRCVCAFKCDYFCLFVFFFFTGRSESKILTKLIIILIIIIAE